MRIISGSHKGRNIHPPKNLPVRPTTDFAKEALFNVLNNRVDFENLNVLDLFCGSGNISYEFISRGCKQITSVDADARCCQFVKQTAEQFKMDNIQVIKSDVFSFVRKVNKQYDLIFCDPPFDMKELGQLPDLIFEHKLLEKDSILIIEHGPTTSFKAHPRLKEERKYGNVHFAFFEHNISLT
jgi:16S rRNA (guanine(966)-N(2))-methyltransferase RsmD